MGGGGGPTFGGAAGLWRMFNAQVGGQIAWLLPLAAVSLVAGLWLTWRAPRTDLRRAGFVLFGIWALVHVAVFSTQQGIFHPYYVSALAPAVAALGGRRRGAVALRARSRALACWRRRRRDRLARRRRCWAGRRTSRRGCGDAIPVAAAVAVVGAASAAARAALAVARGRRPRSRSAPGRPRTRSPTSATR